MTEKEKVEVSVNISLFPIWIAGAMYTIGALIVAEDAVGFLVGLDTLELIGAVVGIILGWPFLLGVMSGL